MRVARVVGAIGRTLIVTGVLLLLFVAYQLWGTSIQEARAQNRLGNDFQAALATTTTTVVAVEDVPAPAPELESGDAVGQLRIPKIGVTRYVVEGVGVGDLKKAPGHYPQTPLPGHVGNAAIAGHRTTYGQPFYRLNELEAGDEIIVQTLEGEFTYLVDRTVVVRPDETHVLDPTPEARLTLTTCEPRFSARKRLIVSAVLRDEPRPTPTTTAPAAGAVEPPAPAFDQAGLSGDPTARWPTLWWGLLTALLGGATYAAARRWRPFWAYAAGSPVFLVVLFVFFENVSRLLPANI